MIKILNEKFMSITKNIPYSIIVKNISDVAKKVVLFGSNRNYHKNNFGNDENIVIENLSGSKENDYGQLLMQLRTEFVKVALLRMTTTNIENFTKHENQIEFKSTDANGGEFGNRIYFRDLVELHKNRLQKMILEIEYPVILNEIKYQGLTIDAQVQIEFNLEPKSEMYFFVFPSEIKELK